MKHIRAIHESPLLRLFLTLGANAIKIEAVVGNLVAGLGGDRLLPLFDRLIDKLIHPATGNTHDVVVVISMIQFKN